MKFKEGYWYIFVIIDHAINYDCIPCLVGGLLYSQDEKTVTIAHWMPLSKDKELNDHNKEVMSIVKSAISKAMRVNVERLLA